MGFLSDRNVGDIVKVRENGGSGAEYIVVHKGVPSSLYGGDCGGVWLMRKLLIITMAFDLNATKTDDARSDYENSAVHAWLNGEFLNMIDEKLRGRIKSVRIPFKKGTGQISEGVLSGANGLACKAFLPSAREVGYTNGSYDVTLFEDGVKLKYFTDDASRIAMLESDGKPAMWTVRSPRYNSLEYFCAVQKNGGCGTVPAQGKYGLRPVFVLPYDLLVDSEGFVSTNLLPVITADKSGDLGLLEDGFSVTYSADDSNAADELDVTLSMDGKAFFNFAAVKNQNYIYSCTGEEWLKITNGDHVFKIEASDGKDVVGHEVRFSRNRTSAFITLGEPCPADGAITACSIKAEGVLPDDCFFKVEVTNNANDEEPVWEDCTARVRQGLTYLFENAAAVNGFAFNFRVSAERGESGAGGYISAVTGGFETAGA